MNAEKREILDERLRNAILAKQHALLLTGNFDDLDEQIFYRRQALLLSLHEAGYLVITYSLSGGGQIFQISSLPEDERKDLEAHMKKFEIPQLFKGTPDRNNSDELIDTFRALVRLLQTTSPRRPLCLVLFYLEHLAPRSEAPGDAEEQHLVISECLHSLCGSAALKKFGNLVIGVGRRGLYNELLNEFNIVEYPYPDARLAKSFIDQTLNEANTKETLLDKELTPESFSQIAAGMKLLDMQVALDEARGRKIPLTAECLSAIKSERLLNNSEGTLRAVQPEITSFVEIIGLKWIIAYLQNFLIPNMRRFAKSVPRMILFSGPAGTGKTILASIIARVAGWALFEFGLTKNMYVGESERRQQLALSIAESAQPVVLVWDEIESFGNRTNGSTQGDSVTGSLISNFLNWSAQEKHRGRVMVIGTCNLPQNLDFALLSRAEVIPILPLKRSELPLLFPAFERRLTGEVTLESNDPLLIEAAGILFKKDASNRHIYSLMCRCSLMASDGRITPELVLQQSRNFVGNAERYPTAIASLMSLYHTSFADLIPDYEEDEIPWWLEGIYQKGELDMELLARRIREYQSLASG
jgi:hypothetical protein